MSPNLINPVLMKRAMRFACTGLFVTGVHVAIAVLFIQHILPLPPLANGVAFVGATAVSYFVNTFWSFSGQLQGKIFLKFLVVSIAGFWLAVLVAFIAQINGLGYLHGILAVALTVPPVTFLMHNFWTYKP
jgi:putative flippase GtrA